MTICSVNSKGATVTHRNRSAPSCVIVSRPIWIDNANCGASCHAMVVTTIAVTRAQNVAVTPNGVLPT